MYIHIIQNAPLYDYGPDRNNPIIHTRPCRYQDTHTLSQELSHRVILGRLQGINHDYDYCQSQWDGERMWEIKDIMDTDHKPRDLLVSDFCNLTILCTASRPLIEGECTRH